MKSSPAPNLLLVTTMMTSTLERSIESSHLSILQPSTSKHEL